MWNLGGCCQLGQQRGPECEGLTWGRFVSLSCSISLFNDSKAVLSFALVLEAPDSALLLSIADKRDVSFPLTGRTYNFFVKEISKVGDVAGCKA